MFAYTPAEPLINSPFVKASFLLCCVLTLAACGGGGGSDTPANNNATNQPPTNVALTTVQASSSDVIDVAWSLAKDDKTIASTLTYQVHLSETAGFSPASETLKFSQKGAVATKLTGLKPATAYSLKLVVIDDDGAQTVSAERTVITQNINVVNQPPTNVALATVQAISSTGVSASWGAASDDTTAASQLTYEVHMAEGGDFSPSASSLKFSGKNVFMTPVTGLKAATTYTVKLVAIDAQGLRSSSSGRGITTLNVFSTALQKLNDTGITKCVFFSIFADCTEGIGSIGSWFDHNQDAEVGRDYLAANGQLTKVGAGMAGFDFTKISAAGEKLPATATAWSCVLDNQTGLMWEMKTNDGGLQDATKTYQWYNTDTSTNGGTVGYANGGNNTQAFTQAINSKALCGYTDWRLPEKQELHSIVNYGKVGPAIDSAYFPNTVSSYYWSSSPVARNINHAWMVDFYAGNDRDYFGNFGNGKGGKADNLYVRLVRSDP